MSKNVECVISPMYCENFEIYCEEQDIDYEFLVNDDDGMHVMMLLSDYLRWYTSIPDEEDMFYDP